MREPTPFSMRPLLFEYGLEAFCDITVGVIAEPEAAVVRLSAEGPGAEGRGNPQASFFSA